MSRQEIIPVFPMEGGERLVVNEGWSRSLGSFMAFFEAAMLIIKMNLYV
jgi:hypothetical protein